MQFKTSRRGLKGSQKGDGHQRFHHAAQQICAVHQLGILQKVSILQKVYSRSGESDPEALLSIVWLNGLGADAVAVPTLINKAVSARAAYSMLHGPVCIETQMGLPHKPTAGDEDCLIGVYGDAKLPPA